MYESITDPMDFEESLNYAIDKNSAIILEVGKKALATQQSIGSGLFWPSPRQPLLFKAAKVIGTQAHGSGLFPGNNNEDYHDDPAIHEKIWRIISHNDYYDELSSLKFFVRLRQAIEHDQTFQRVIKRTRALLLRDDGGEHLTFNDALDKIVEDEKSLIYKSFVDNTKEEKCASDDQAPSNSENDVTSSVWCLILK